MNEQLILMTKRLLLSCVLLSTANAEWEALPSLPEPNGGFMCGVVGDNIVTVGGTNWVAGKKNWLKGVRVFDPSTMKWSKGKDLEMPWAYGSVVQGGDNFAIFGGFDGVNSVKQFAWGDLEGLKPHRDLDQPEGIVLAAGGAVGELVVIAGGTNDPANVAGVSRSTYLFKWGKSSPGRVLLGTIYAEANIQPSQLPFGLTGSFEIVEMHDYPGKPFATAASAVVGGELFVFGGLNWNESSQAVENSTAAYAFDPAKNTWRTIRSLTTPVRGVTAVALDDHQIYIAGGYTDDFTTDAVIYDVKTDSYRKAQPLPYAAMVALVKLDGYVYCLGGEDKMKSRTDKFFRIPVAELLK